LDITVVPEQPSDASDRAIVEAVSRTSDALAATAAEALGEALVSFDIYGILAALTDLAAALGVASPLLFAAHHFGRQNAQVQRVWSGWTATETAKKDDHLAVFSDAVGKHDGVSTWCRHFSQRAAASRKRVWLATCDDAAHDAGPEAMPRPYPALARFKIPLYPELEICVPSLAATVDRLWREGITHVEVATPGPMGLVGLAAARILGLPVTATYHTDFAALLQLWVADPKLSDLARAYLGWFYRRVDRTFVFSQASRDRVLELRVPPEQVEAIVMTVDPTDFSPACTSTSIFSELGVPAGDRPVVLTVGRLSGEKNVASIVEAVRGLQHRQPAPLLVVVGDGPAAAALQRSCCSDDFVVFLGTQTGRPLRELYASASIFVFASRIDGLGLVNLEALSSGVPVLVPCGSAIAESLHDGHDALFFDASADGLRQALAALLDNPGMAAKLAANGRQHMVSRWQEVQFEAVWQRMAGTKPSLDPA
ncbi:MAG: glycosyltransferase, partial [Pseudomonadota bacterium]|nr:glycosyltransferase [Pseudomonadota bacterium]